jgi:hypothetical protein
MSHLAHLASRPARPCMHRRIRHACAGHAAMHAEFAMHALVRPIKPDQAHFLSLHAWESMHASISHQIDRSGPESQSLSSVIQIIMSVPIMQ